MSGHLIRHLTGVTSAKKVPPTRRELAKLTKLSNHVEARYRNISIHFAGGRNLMNVAKKRGQHLSIK